MLSKEEIEKEKQQLRCIHLADRNSDNLCNAIKRVEQLESDKQKLIEKLEGLYSKLQKEHDIAIDNFIKKDIPFCAEDGAISQEVGFIIGQLEEILKGEKE